MLLSLFKGFSSSKVGFCVSMMCFVCSLTLDYIFVMHFIISLSFFVLDYRLHSPIQLTVLYHVTILFLL